MVTLWVLIVVPILLALMLGAILLLLPRLATTAWDSGRLLALGGTASSTGSGSSTSTTTGTSTSATTSATTPATTSSSVSSATSSGG